MRRIPIEQRRRELLAAAARVIARDGLAAASTRAIVAEADMPLGAMHYVFDSRDDLLRSLISEVAKDERSAIISVVEASSGHSIDELLRVGLGTYLGMLEEHPEQELAIAELSLHAARHDPAVAREQWQGYHALAAEALVRAADLCGVRWVAPVEHIAHSFICVLDGITLTWLATRDGDAMRRHLDLIVPVFAALAVPTQR